MTAHDLVNNVLLGDGVEASNISINGLSANAVLSQFGYFDATQSNIGLDKGIILATGGATVAVGPNNWPAANVPVPENERFDFAPDLATIMSPAVLKDVAVLEFDFVAVGDTVRFKYVFASEEYNEHVCSPYNDAFGFFISGPGISGSFSNQAINAATIPGTNIPVAINTVNLGVAGEYGSASICNAASNQWQSNHIYFVDNENNTDPNATQFDGFTVPMEVKIPVVCGETYHIKIAIADANDENNDSAVFIEAGSFTSTPPLAAQVEIINPDSLGRAVEGCSTFRFTLSRKDSVGAATYYIKTPNWQDVDGILPTLPDSVTLYNLQRTKTFDVPVETNHNHEGFRNYEIHFLEYNACSVDTSIKVIQTPVMDFPELEVQYPDTVMLNCVETGNINFQVSGGYGNQEITWSNVAYQGFNIVVNPTDNELLTAEIYDQCRVNTEEIKIWVERKTYAPLEVTLPKSATYNCIKPVQLEPVISGGYGDYSVSWYQNDNLLHTGISFNQIIDNDSYIKVVVSDLCADDVVKFVSVSKKEVPLSLQLEESYTGTCKTDFIIIPEVAGGLGTLQYSWMVNGIPASNDMIFISKMTETSLVELTLTDACNNQISGHTMVYVTTTPLSVSLPSDTVICANEVLELYPEIKWGEGNYTYYWNDKKVDEVHFKDTIPHSTILTFKAVDECKNTVVQTCKVEVIEVHADFDFRYEHPGRLLENKSSPGVDYFWFFPDGSSDYVFEPGVDFSVLENGSVTLLVKNDVGCEDEIAKDFTPEARVYVPNAFTPDGDGINEIFKAEGEHIVQFEMHIFNRWGKEIFYTNDISVGWNGDDGDTGAPTGVYSYRYQAVDKFGRKKEGFGSIHLMR